MNVSHPCDKKRAETQCGWDEGEDRWKYYNTNVKKASLRNSGEAESIPNAEKDKEKGLHRKKKWNKVVYIRVWTGKPTKSLSTDAQLCPERGSLLDLRQKRTLSGICADVRAHVHTWEGPSLPRQHTARYRTEANTTNQWKISFRQHNLSIKNNIDPFASWPKRNQLRQRKLGNRFNVTPTAAVK